ncbi:PREDICTED: cytochrome P450 4c3-like [Nicrophorus vespilloides]|uniref:Cytochrome P450 4c3-like n=1 Tax=Nicrophorus vespilloides TaxID=110193 RepID=A0ABM1NCP6_NICVS|nr:PREDICTED: cytochrome P450 4c3-like [Nicrophorus vespilloides]
MAYIIVYTLIIIAAAWFAKFLFDVFSVRRKLRNVKTPPDNLLLGESFKFTSTAHFIPALTKYFKHFGNHLNIYHGFLFSFILTADTKFLEHILTSTKILKKSEDYAFFKRWLGEGLLTSTGQKWFRSRKILTPAFHFQILEQFIETFHSKSNILLEKIEKMNGNSFNIYPFVTSYTLDVICETAMGTNVNAQLNAESAYVKSVRTMGEIVARRSFNIFTQNDFLYFFTKDYRTEKKLVAIIHEYTNSVIAQRKKVLESQNIDTKVNELGRKRRLAFLDLMLQSSVDGQILTDEEIRDEVNTFMFAGHDTTASALTFTMFCLAQNTEIQNKVLEELKLIFRNDEDKYRPIVYKDLQEMKYLEMVIKESLRLFPPVPIIAREVDEDINYDGVTLPPGVPLGMFTYGLHRDQNIFPDPEKFDPERFTAENQSKRNAFSYIPFSAGPRNCIGQRFAMFEIKSTLAMVLRRFQLLPVEDFEMILSYEIVLKSKNGVYIKFAERIF